MREDDDGDRRPQGGGRIVCGCNTAIPTIAHAQQSSNEAVMAVPVSGLAFSLGYLADDLNLWEEARHQGEDLVQTPALAR